MRLLPRGPADLVKLLTGVDEALLPSLLTLSDVFCTGHHAAVKARVSPRTTALGVVRDGGVIGRVGAAQYAEVPMDFGTVMRTPDGYRAMAGRETLKVLIRP